MTDNKDIVSEAEKLRLAKLEGIIFTGIKAVFDMGAAMKEIRDTRLYRARCATWKEYCREVWDMGVRLVDYQIAASDVIENLKEDAHNCAQNIILPANEAQARPLTALDPPQQIEAWEIVLEKAEWETGRKITAKLVSSVVAEHLRRQTSTEIEKVKKRVSREDLISDTFHNQYQKMIEIVAMEINSGFKETSKVAVLKHIDALRNLVENAGK